MMVPVTLSCPLVLRPPAANISPEAETKPAFLIEPETPTSPLVSRPCPKMRAELDKSPVLTLLDVIVPVMLVSPLVLNV